MDSAGDGGADVLLFDDNQVGVTDRKGDDGSLYSIQYTSEGEGQVKFGRKTGIHPRYSTCMTNGDVVSCNMNENTLTIFKNLKAHPFENVETRKVSSCVEVPSFILEEKSKNEV